MPRNLRLQFPGAYYQHSHLRRGWYWGGQAFAEKLRGLAGQVMKDRERHSRAYHRTPQTQDHSQEQAERWLKDGLKAAGLDAHQVTRLKGSDPRKLALAELLWKHTTVSQEWIAEQLAMRSAANVSQQLRRMKRGTRTTKLPSEMLRFLAEARGCQPGKD